MILRIRLAVDSCTHNVVIISFAYADGMYDLPRDLAPVTPRTSAFAVSVL